MTFFLSTNYLSERITRGEALVEKVLSLGFNGIELGYLLTDKQIDQIEVARKSCSLEIESLHSFCPVPFGAPYGYPELYAAASPDADERALACLHLQKSLECAARFGAKKVVYHAGRIRMRRFGFSYSSKLKQLALESSPKDEAYVRQLAKERLLRAKASGMWFDGMCRSLDALLPRFEALGVALCLENLPSFEAFPDMEEFQRLRERFPTRALLHWHDIGHGEVRGNYEWDDPLTVTKTLLNDTAGIHIHDVEGLEGDHCAPGAGSVDFTGYAFYGGMSTITRVFEPGPTVPEDVLMKGLALIRRQWDVQP